ncbi:MAG: molybdate ABC transporter substrate-binding protein [Acidimicrobiia bacterium]
MLRRSLFGSTLAAMAVTRVQAQPAGPTVFAAASLKTTLDGIAGEWVKSGKALPRLSYAGSPALARQIEQGAPADIFISADLDWMDYVERKNLIKPATRVHLLGNKIVLIAGKDSKVSAALTPTEVARALAGGKLSMANTDTVPAGKYGKAALEKLGIWDAVKSNVVQAENVRAALVLVARGEASLGVVYATDAAAEQTVRVVAEFPTDSHPPIIYPMAELKDSRHADAKTLLGLLMGAKARAVFEKQGFTVLVKSYSAT